VNSRATMLLLVTTLALTTAKAEVSYNEVIAWIETNGDAPTDGLAPGAYDVRRLSELARYIPPGFLGEFDFPELEVELSETRHYQPHSSYQAATKRFAGTATLDADGALKSYTAGQPFSAE